MVKVCFAKLGNIAASLVADLILDERADREITIRTISTGAKLGKAEAEELSGQVSGYDLVVVISPNAGLPGPKLLRAAVKPTPCIVISDGPSKKAIDDLKSEGCGYIIIHGDPLIGARRQFLDPTEMVIFNSQVLNILAVSGTLRLIKEELDKVINALDKGEDVELPQVEVTPKKAANSARFNNPYARAKAMAAYGMATAAADVNVQACFVQQNPDDYIITAASAHELIKAASALADEAREMEKSTDTLYRGPHANSGELLSKRGLLDKPE